MTLRRGVELLTNCSYVARTCSRLVEFKLDDSGEDIREEFLREGEHRALAVVNVPVAIARACFEVRRRYQANYGE